MLRTGRAATIVLALAAALLLAFTVVACGGGPNRPPAPRRRRGVSAPAGQRAGHARPGGLRRDDRQPVLADDARAAAGSTARPTARAASSGSRSPSPTRRRTILGIAATVVHDVVTRGRRGGRGHVRLVRPGPRRATSGTSARRRRSTRTGRSSTAGLVGGRRRRRRRPASSCPADPRSGMTYRQEYYAGEAEDAGEILSLDEWVEVPFGSFRDVLMTKDSTPLEPDVARAQVLRAGRRAGPGPRDLRRLRPGGAHQLRARAMNDLAVAGLDVLRHPCSSR